MTTKDDPADSGGNYDPVYLNTVREAGVILIIFAVAAVWTITVCYSYGYAEFSGPPRVISTTLGMPQWVFWGIFIPWCCAMCVSVWFGLSFMADDLLGNDPQEGDQPNGDSLNDQTPDRQAKSASSSETRSSESSSSDQSEGGAL